MGVKGEGEVVHGGGGVQQEVPWLQEHRAAAAEVEGEDRGQGRYAIGEDGHTQ